MKNKVFIIKASGVPAPFSVNKLKKSLQRSGANRNEVERIAEQISAQIHSGMSTKEIYKMAFNLLKRDAGYLAARYNLKRAIMELGPSGFPFEKFISEILACQGFKTKTQIIVHGQCVKHEIDVIAEKNEHHILIECKYHNHTGIFCDVKVPLYIQSRFKDVEVMWKKEPELQGKKFTAWVVTNTRFSYDAMQYGHCAGLTLYGWDYPINKGLKDQVDKLGLYPVTCLTTLTKSEKTSLLDRGIVLCRDIYENESILTSLKIKGPRFLQVKEEVDKLCSKLICNNQTIATIYK